MTQPGNKNEVYKAITILKCVMLLTLTCRNFKHRYIGRHIAVTPFKLPPLFRKPKNDKISKRSGVRLVAADCPDTAGYFKSKFELYISKNASIKIF